MNTLTNKVARLEATAVDVDLAWLDRIPAHAIDEIVEARPEQSFYVAAKWRRWLREQERPGNEQLIQENEQ